MDKNNICKNKNNSKVENNKENSTKILVPPTRFLNDDNKVDSIAPLQNDRINLILEEKLDEGVIILDGIKFKGIEDIKQNPFILQMESFSDSQIIDEAELSTPLK